VTALERNRRYSLYFRS